MMRILIAIDTLGFGGAEKQVVMDANGLCRRGADVTVACFKDGPLASELLPGVRVERISSRSYAGRVAHMRRILQRLDIDVVHAHMFRAEVVAAIAGRLAGRPVVFNEHGLGRWRGAHHVLVFRWAASLAREVWCASEECRLLRVRGERISEVKTRTVYNSFVPWEPTPEASGELRRTWAGASGIDPERMMVVGFVGRFDPVKRLPLLVEAARLLGDRDVLFVLVGDGKGRPEVEERIAAGSVEDRFLLPGFVHTPRAYYEAFDIFVLPSERESLSIALIEAGNCAVPAIAFDVGGNREIVRNEETGLLLPSDGSAQDLANALRVLLDDRERRRRLGRTAASRARILFSEDIRMDFLLRNYAAMRQRAER